jgi:hypothetical protein
MEERVLVESPIITKEAFICATLIIKTVIGRTMFWLRI